MKKYITILHASHQRDVYNIIIYSLEWWKFFFLTFLGRYKWRLLTAAVLSCFCCFYALWESFSNVLLILLMDSLNCHYRMITLSSKNHIMCPWMFATIIGCGFWVYNHDKPFNSNCIRIKVSESGIWLLVWSVAIWRLCQCTKRNLRCYNSADSWCI